MTRAFTNILTDDVDATAKFYEDLLGMHRHFAADWFVVLVHGDRPGFELGILRRGHAIVPADIRDGTGGVILTFVVADTDACHARARDMGAEVIEPPRDMEYGQRRMLLRDPAGVTVDISAPTVPPA